MSAVRTNVSISLTLFLIFFCFNSEATKKILTNFAGSRMPHKNAWVVDFVWKKVKSKQAREKKLMRKKVCDWVTKNNARAGVLRNNWVRLDHIKAPQCRKKKCKTKFAQKKKTNEVFDWNLLVRKFEFLLFIVFLHIPFVVVVVF